MRRRSRADEQPNRRTYRQAWMHCGLAGVQIEILPVPRPKIWTMYKGPNLKNVHAFGCLLFFRAIWMSRYVDCCNQKPCTTLLTYFSLPEQNNCFLIKQLATAVPRFSSARRSSACQTRRLDAGSYDSGPLAHTKTNQTRNKPRTCR